MALQSIKGIYKDGKVELSEKPESVTEPVEVLVTFLQPSSDETARKAAIERMLQRMDRGIDLGGSPYPKREEIYDERIRRITDRLSGH